MYLKKIKLNIGTQLALENNNKFHHLKSCDIFLPP